MTDGSNIGPVLKEYLDRIKSVEHEITLLKEDQKEIWDEVKRKGLDVKALRAAYALSKKDKAERDAIIEYGEALSLWD